MAGANVAVKLQGIPKQTLTFDTADTVQYFDAEKCNGFLRFLIVSLPNFTTAATAILTITDADSYVIYCSDILTENAQHNIPIEDGLVPLVGTNRFTLTLNAGAGGDDEIAYVKAYYR